MTCPRRTRSPSRRRARRMRSARGRGSGADGGVLRWRQRSWAPAIVKRGRPAGCRGMHGSGKNPPCQQSKPTGARPVYVRLVRVALVSLLVGLAVATVAPSALADKRTEAAAKAAMKKAQGDYLGMNYGTGATRLQKALKACGTTKCSAGVQAALLVDMGSMLFRAGTKDDAANAWAQAVKLQPGIALNPAYAAPEM